MSQSVAIVIAGVLIAAAVLVANRWQIEVESRQQYLQVYRLDRWTGKVSACSNLNPYAMLSAGTYVPCEAPK